MIALAGGLFVAVAGQALAAVPGAAPPPTTATPGTPVPTALLRFFQYQRPATYGSLRLQVQVPVRDGVDLGCYLYEPETEGTAHEATGTFPGIIDNFTPYYLADPAGAYSGVSFAEHGYLDLECTPRGTGTSGGAFPGWFSAQEARDNYDLIEWLAHRPDSTGKVGQEGNSYGGITAYRVAALHPPALVTIAPQQSYASLYLDFDYPGGIRSLGDPYWDVAAAFLGGGRNLASTQEAMWVQHPLLDSYWQQIDISGKWSQIHLPVLGFGGWADIFQNGMVLDYLALAGPNTYLIDGPWTHGNTFDATVTGGALLAWFDHWLRGDAAAPLPPTHVASYQMPAGPWQALPAWPPAGGREVLALTTAGGLGPAGSGAGPAGSGAGPAGARSYTASPGGGAADLPSGDHLIFTGAPLAQAEQIGGAAVIRLVATLSGASGGRADTNFVLHLSDVAPGGATTLITRGYLKASHYRSQSHPATLPLGQAIAFTIPLWQV
ncbi:MAG TPA: CocE/NonD family hydrolase, partial [Acidimicrobiales bacterium]